jgi:hypothetical protein
MYLILELTSGVGWVERSETQRTQQLEDLGLFRCVRVAFALGRRLREYSSAQSAIRVTNH